MTYYKNYYTYQDGGEGFATQAEASDCFSHEFEQERRAAELRNAAIEAIYIHCRRAIAEEFNARYEYSLHAADGKQIGESFAAAPGEARALQQMYKLEAISCADLLRIEAGPAPERWTARRAPYELRRQGNRDLYLTHPSGARASIYPRGGEAGRREPPFVASLAGGVEAQFATRREALAWVKRWGVVAYEDGPDAVALWLDADARVSARHERDEAKARKAGETRLANLIAHRRRQWKEALAERLARDERSAA